MLGLSKSQRDVWLSTTALKLLLFPAYKSTDFEVHRNWLALTHNLPLREWYYEKTSEWTLDYPPFFAYFSYLLSLPAHLLSQSFRSHLLTLSSTAVEGWGVIAYMRSTVILSEVVLITGLQRLCRGAAGMEILSMAIAFHPGFLILDNIHFQYNGFLFGIMIWSLVGAKEGRPLVCAGFFAALLMFKHIYIYLAPAWFIYLLRAYCIPASSGLTLHLQPLIKIGAVTLTVFAIALGPFLYLGQGSQLISRLFPFTRGLMHAYWAPNAWAGVTLVDRILVQAVRRFHLPLTLSASGLASTSRGLVGDTSFAVLPNILPIHCFILTALTQAVTLTPLWRRPDYKTFLQDIAGCGFASFMFGWHVHEKAVMLVLVPLSLLAAEDWNHYRAFLVASISGIISLFPLLFKPAETPIKMGYSIIWLVIVIGHLKPKVSKPQPSIPSFLLSSIENVYLLSSIPLLGFTSILHPVLTRLGRIPESMEFLPLMMISVWCSFGLWISWARVLWGMFVGSSDKVGGLKID